MLNLASSRILHDPEPVITRVFCGRCPRILLGATKFSYPTRHLCACRQRSSATLLTATKAVTHDNGPRRSCKPLNLWRLKRNLYVVCIRFAANLKQFDIIFRAGRNLPTGPSCARKHEERGGCLRVRISSFPSGARRGIADFFFKCYRLSDPLTYMEEFFAPTLYSSLRTPSMVQSILLPKP